MRTLFRVIAVLASTAQVFAASPFEGTWKLNVRKSTFGPKGGPKQQIAVIAEQGDVAEVSIKGIDQKGSAFALRYTVSMKGGPAKFLAGAREGLALTYKRIDERSIDETYTMNGEQVGVSHMTVSADGKTLRVDQPLTDAQGKSSAATIFFDRQ